MTTNTEIKMARQRMSAEALLDWDSEDFTPPIVAALDEEITDLRAALEAKQQALEAAQQVAQRAGSGPDLTVWEGAMPESNGKSNFTAVLMRKETMWDGPHVTIERSEYPDRIRYEADRVRYLIGEIANEPFILDYDADMRSDYTAPPAAVQPDSEPRYQVREIGEGDWRDASKGEYEHCRRAPEMDTRIFVAKPINYRLQNWIDVIHDNERSMGDRLQHLATIFGGLLRGDAMDKYPLAAIREQQPDSGRDAALKALLALAEYLVMDREHETGEGRTLAEIESDGELPGAIMMARATLDAQQGEKGSKQ